MEIDYFIGGPQVKANRVASTKNPQIMHNSYSDLFTEIGHSKKNISVQNKADVKPYQTLHKCIGYELQEPSRKELEILQQILALLGVDETAEWCNSFVIVSEPNGMVLLGLDPMKLNHALIKPVQRGQSTVIYCPN